MSYLEWLSEIAIPDTDKRLSYQKLLSELYSTEFTWFVKNDDNRAGDGLELRRTYKNETGLLCTNQGPCSVLEMMVALAKKCEDRFMYDPDLGDRTGEWFWEMIVNLGLDRMDDWAFDYDAFDEIMERLLNRKYDKNGYGGLFYIEGTRIDMRKTEIWYQLNYWLRSRFEW